MITTRTACRADGTSEIIRVIDDNVLKRWSPKNPLAFEQSIVWLQPIDGLDFVRVAIVRMAKSRRGPLSCSGRDIAVGYSKLTVDALRDPATGFYVRRLFYLRERDSQINMNQIPPRAIDPRSLLPGLDGQAPRADHRGYPQYLCRTEGDRVQEDCVRRSLTYTATHLVPR